LVTQTIGENNMTNKLLGIIAINLTIITGLLALQAIPTATAHTGENDWYSERYEYGFKSAVESIVEDCQVSFETSIRC
tara:strand:- start:89 stop:322 length:234 start_codon:yes stop_codon:yes gene_type:complete